MNNKRSRFKSTRTAPVREGDVSGNKSNRWRWVGLFLAAGCLFFSMGPGSQTQLVGIRDTRWDKMTESVEQMAAKYDGDVAIYIKDLSTGRVYERNGDRPFLSASLIKIPIMAATLKAIRDGRISMGSKVKLKRYHRAGGSGKLKWARLGTSYSVSKLLYSMITDSDNTAASMLISLLGYQYLNDSFDDFGLRMTRISRSGMSLSNYLDPDKDNYTTAREMGSMLEKIYERRLVSDGMSDLMMEIMKGADAKSRLRKYLPENWKLARKTGLLRKNCHDVGIVFTPKGDYIICVLTGHNRTYGQAKGLISSVGQEAYSYIGSAS